MNRRNFLGASIAGLVPIRAARQPARARRVHASPFEPWIEVHAGHLAHNATEVARRTQRPVLAVIKNNGYGLGVVQVAKALESHASVAGFAVVKVQEALDLRSEGIEKPVLLMGSMDAGDLSLVIAQGIMPMVYTPVGDTLQREAARLGRAVPIHVCVDAGMGREGVPIRSAAALIRDLAARPGVTIAGTMMVCSEDLEFDKDMLRRFSMLTRELSASGVRLGRLHAASTYTLFQLADAALDMVRPGMALFGIYPDAGFRAQGLLDLKPAVAFRVRVGYVKRLSAGMSAGYDRAYMATRDTWIATLPVGHVDGWPRVAANGARVRINGLLYPVVASVSASHTIVEIGDAETVRAGDVATLFDWEDGSRPEDVAASSKASVYDLTMHLNPLLDRRVVTE